jgi:LPXTG-motif cell wall-anchored protein
VTSESSSTSTSTAVSRTKASSTVSATASATEVPDDTNKSSSSSKAWIAGAVVGPVVGVALIAALGWFLWRRKQRQHPSPQEMPIVSEHSRPPIPPTELEATPQEMDSGHYAPVHELSSYSYK